MKLAPSTQLPVMQSVSWALPLIVMIVSIALWIVAMKRPTNAITFQTILFVMMVCFATVQRSVIQRSVVSPEFLPVNPLKSVLRSLMNVSLLVAHTLKAYGKGYNVIQISGVLISTTKGSGTQHFVSRLAMDSNCVVINSQIILHWLTAPNSLTNAILFAIIPAKLTMLPIPVGETRIMVLVKNFNANGGQLSQTSISEV